MATDSNAHEGRAGATAAGAAVRWPGSLHLDLVVPSGLQTWEGELAPFEIWEIA